MQAARMTSATSRTEFQKRAWDLTHGRGMPQLWGRRGFWQIKLRWAVAP